AVASIGAVGLLLVHRHAEERALRFAQIKEEKANRGQKSPKPLRANNPSSDDAALVQTRRELSRAVIAHELKLNDLEKLDLSPRKNSDIRQRHALYPPKGPYNFFHIQGETFWTLHRRVLKDGTLQDTLY